MKTFHFGENLLATELEASDSTPGDPVEAVGEEPVETLLAGNLDRFFAGWNLRLCQMSNAGWGVPDLVAMDPAGGLHVFEIKDEGTEVGLLEQALGYALTTATRQPVIPWSEMRPLEDTAFLATRIGGFWATKRKMQRTDKLPAASASYSERSYCRLEQVSLELAASPKYLIGLAQTWPSVGPFTNWQQRDVHVHIVVDGIAPGDDLPQRIEHLIDRGVRISLWNCRVRRSKVSRSGWVQWALLSKDQQAMRWIANLAAHNLDAATGWMWSYEKHSTGAGAYARAKDLLGEVGGLALLDEGGTPCLTWGFSVPTFATTERWNNRVRECKAFGKRLGSSVAIATGLTPKVSEQRFRLALPSDGWVQPLAIALSAIKAASSDARRLLCFDDCQSNTCSP